MQLYLRLHVSQLGISCRCESLEVKRLLQLFISRFKKFADCRVTQRS